MSKVFFIVVIVVVIATNIGAARPAVVEESARHRRLHAREVGEDVNANGNTSINAALAVGELIVAAGKKRASRPYSNTEPAQVVVDSLDSSSFGYQAVITNVKELEGLCHIHCHVQADCFAGARGALSVEASASAPGEEVGAEVNTEFPIQCQCRAGWVGDGVECRPKSQDSEPYATEEPYSYEERNERELRPGELDFA
eukprot:Nk52_evm15s296 gene=Nk52_evmTU15s296